MLEEEKEILQQAVASCRVAGDTVQNLNNENRRLWKALIACVVCIAVMACCMVWGVANAQKIANEAMLSALQTVGDIGVTTEETTTTTTTQSIEGDSATINNVEGQQYNDSATNNGGGE